MNENTIKLQAYLSKESCAKKQLLNKLKEDRNNYKYHYVGTLRTKDVVELIEGYLDMLECDKNDEV